MTIDVGTRLGPYEIVRRIGAGGMGEVWRARDKRLGRDVAIKILPSGFASDEMRRARFEREARTIAALSHPNVCVLHDVGQENGVHYLVMELLEGESLGERLKRERIPLEQLLRIGAQIADGLDRAHEKGIVHRDLTPGNVMLTKSGAKLLDFGLAHINSFSFEEMRQISTEVRPITAEGTLLGTMPYMAPEQLHGKETDARTDIFALGAVLYEMATGIRAFTGNSRASLIAAIVSGEPRPVREMQPLTPPQLEHVIRRCLEKDPDDRWQSARDIAAELRWIAERRSDEIAISPVPRRINRWKAATGILGLVAVVAAGVATVEYRSAREQARVPAVAGLLPTFRQLTFRRGNTINARFSPDGQTVIYSASWDGAPMQAYAVSRNGADPRALGISNAMVAAVSERGELAVILQETQSRVGSNGTLARVAQIGGAPRVLTDHVWWADWLPGGEDMVASRLTGDEWVVELPLGNVIYRSKSKVFDCNVSPDGTRVVIVERMEGFITDRKGTKLVTFDARGATGFSWSPDGRDLIVGYQDSRIGGGGRIDAIAPDGKARTILSSPGSVTLYDVASDGSVLFDPGVKEQSIELVRGGVEKELSWLGNSIMGYLAADGQAILVWDRKPDLTGLGAYIRRLDGTPPTFLHARDAFAPRPDASAVLASAPDDPELLQLVPTGIGAPRDIGRWTDSVDGVFLPDNSAAIILGTPEGGEFGIHRLDVDRGSVELVSKARVARRLFMLRPSPDSRFVGLASPDSTPAILDLHHPDEVRLVPATAENETLVGWGAESRSVFIVTDGLPRELYRVELATGRRSHVRTLQPVDSVGVMDVHGTWAADDGRTIVSSVLRIHNSNIWIAEGIFGDVHP